MAEKENVQVVKGAYEAFGRRDIQGVLGMTAEDVDWFTPGPPDTIPYAGRRRGRREVGEFFAALAGAEEITHFEPQEFIAQGDRVAVLGNYKGRVLANSRGYDIDWLHVFTVRDGRIESFREYFDTAALADAYRAAVAQRA